MLIKINILPDSMHLVAAGTGSGQGKVVGMVGITGNATSAAATRLSRRRLLKDFLNLRLDGGPGFVEGFFAVEFSDWKQGQRDIMYIYIHTYIQVCINFPYAFFHVII